MANEYFVLGVFLVLGVVSVLGGLALAEALQWFFATDWEAEPEVTELSIVRDFKKWEAARKGDTHE